MHTSCIHFGQMSPYLTWAHVCGFYIEGVPQTMYGWGDRRIESGTSLMPFVGFYTDSELAKPECSGTSSIKISLVDADNGSILSFITLTAEPTTSYYDWFMPSITMPNRDINLKFQIHITTPSTVLATETNSFYIRVVQCSTGQRKCEGGYWWNCVDGRWVNTYESCDQPPECTDGETKCVGENRYDCENGAWVDKGQDPSCASQPQCDPTNEPYKCEDCRLYKCVGGQWVYEPNKPFVEDIKYCGIQCNPYLIIGVAAAAIVCVGAIAYYLSSRREEQQSQYRQIEYSR